MSVPTPRDIRPPRQVPSLSDPEAEDRLRVLLALLDRDRTRSNSDLLELLDVVLDLEEDES